MAERFNIDRVKRPMGSQPSFNEHPTVEALTGMVIALLGEVAVLRDRIDASERLSAAGGVHGPEEVDRFQADPEARLARQGVRTAMYDRVLGVAVDRLAPEQLKQEQTSYDQVLKDVSIR
jgi:hypothetical protein